MKFKIGIDTEYVVSAATLADFLYIFSMNYQSQTEQSMVHVVLSDKNMF